jgi:hypothetical protein
LKIKKKENVWIFFKNKNYEKVFFFGFLDKKKTCFSQKTTRHPVEPDDGKAGEEDMQR